MLDDVTGEYGAFNFRVCHVPLAESLAELISQPRILRYELLKRTQSSKNAFFMRTVFYCFLIA